MTAPVDCRRLMQVKAFRDPQGTSHTLGINDTTSVYFQKVGHLIHYSSGPSCYGGTYNFRGQSYKNMVVTVNRKFKLQELPAEMDEELNIHVPSLNLVLPCSSNKKDCMTQNHGTFFWDDLTPVASCPFYPVSYTHLTLPTTPYV